MMKANGLLAFFDEVLRSMGRSLGQEIDSYCDLETAHDEHTLVAEDGGLCTFIEIIGTKRIVGAIELEYVMEELSRRFSQSFRTPGRMLQVTFVRDKGSDQTMEDIATQVSRLREGSRASGINIDDLIDERYQVLRKYCWYERVVIVVWTFPATLPSGLMKAASKEHGNNIRGSIASVNAQRWLRAMQEVVELHTSFVSDVHDALKSDRQVGYQVEKLTAAKACKLIRSMNDAEFTSVDWSPILPQDAPVLRMPERYGKDDFAELMWPRLGEQLLPRGAAPHSPNSCRVGDRLYAPISIKVPPSKPQPFNRLLTTLRESDIPWRLQIWISGGGLEGLGMKQTFATMLERFNRQNKLIVGAIKDLKTYEDHGGAVVGLRVDACTWAPADEERTLRSRAAILARAMQAWGSSQTDDLTGNPLQGFASSVPGLTTSSVSPMAAAKFDEVISMLPLTRPSSPWRNGHCLFRTPDGKLFPYSSFSKLQTAWITLIFAPMGYGKSVFANTLNLGLMEEPDNEGLPFIRMIDIGSSSHGVVSLAQSGLPKEKRHLATFKRLTMSRSSNMNMFDTLLGCRYPTSSKKAFLTSYLSVLCTPLGQDQPYDGVTGVLSLMVDEIYKRLSDGGAPHGYRRTEEPLVDVVVDRHGVQVDRSTSWYEIVDALFDLGYTREALLAQRRAVPTLDEIAAIAKEPVITELYTGKTPTQETIPDYVWRALLEAISLYPLLSGHTEFDVGETRILSLDLMDVAPKGGPQADRQTALMYALTMEVLTSEFFLNEEVLREIPGKYRGYHSKRMELLARVPKRLFADEFHRASKSAAINLAIEQFIVEGRKFRIEVVLASQVFTDFTPKMIDQASTVIVLGVGTSGSKDIAERFGFEESERVVLEQRLRGPTPEGANFLARFKTRDGDYTHLLTNTLGPIEIWAFSTTATDRFLRDQLYKMYPADVVRKALSQKYPSGSAEGDIERRRAHFKATKAGFAELPAEEANATLLAEIMNDMKAQIGQLLSETAIG